MFQPLCLVYTKQANIFGQTVGRIVCGEESIINICVLLKPVFRYRNPGHKNISFSPGQRTALSLFPENKTLASCCFGKDSNPAGKESVAANDWAFRSLVIQILGFGLFSIAASNPFLRCVQLLSSIYRSSMPQNSFCL